MTIGIIVPRNLYGDKRLEWLQRSLEEHQQYCNPDLDWKQTSCTCSELEVNIQFKYHQHVEDKAAPEDGDVAPPPLWSHELAVEVEHWRRL